MHQPHRAPLPRWRLSEVHVRGQGTEGGAAGHINQDLTPEHEQYGYGLVVRRAAACCLAARADFAVNPHAAGAALSKVLCTFCSVRYVFRPFLCLTSPKVRGLRYSVVQSED